MGGMQRVGVKAVPKAVSVQQVRGVKTVDFAGHKETVYGEFAIVAAELLLVNKLKGII